MMISKMLKYKSKIYKKYSKNLQNINKLLKINFHKILLMN